MNPYQSPVYCEPPIEAVPVEWIGSWDQWLTVILVTPVLFPMISLAVLVCYPFDPKAREMVRTTHRDCGKVFWLWANLPALAFYSLIAFGPYALDQLLPALKGDFP